VRAGKSRGEADFEVEWRPDQAAAGAGGAPCAQDGGVATAYRGIVLAFHEAQPAMVSAVEKSPSRGHPPRGLATTFCCALITRKRDGLRFLTDPRVPFTNNLAEREGPDDEAAA